MTKERLDQFVLDIEFLLISVVQGVALGALAASSNMPFSQLDYQYWPYIITGICVILFFWSQAIIHALSFINWPLDLTHNFLYFLAAFFEVLAFNNLTNPLNWFAFMTGFSIIAGILYWVDLRLIKVRKGEFEKTGEGLKLYQHIISEQIKEFKTLVPSGIFFNLLSLWLIWRFPETFIAQGIHVYLIGFQVIFSVGILLVSINSFKKRSKLIYQGLTS